MIYTKMKVHIKKSEWMFVLPILVNCVSGFGCKATNETITLNNDEQTCVLLSEGRDNNTNSLRMNIKLVKVEIRYKISNAYTYYHPSVEVDCECSCGCFPGYCSSDTLNRTHRCVSLNRNRTDQLCVNYYEEGKNISECKDSYKMCCQATFSIHENSPQFRAVQLQKSSLQMILEITLQNQTVRRYIEQPYLSASDAKRIRHDDFVLFELNQLPYFAILPDGWYYYADEKLMRSSFVNEFEGNDLNKFGWFQAQNDGQLRFIPPNHVKKHLKITPKICRENSPKYDWELKAVNFFRGEKLHSPKEGFSVLDIYKNEISNMKVDFNENVVSFQVKNPKPLTIRVQQERNFSEQTYSSKNYSDFDTKKQRVVFPLARNTSIPFNGGNRTDNFIDANWKCLLKPDDQNEQLCIRSEIKISRPRQFETVRISFSDESKAINRHETLIQMVSSYKELRETAILFGIILPSLVIMVFISLRSIRHTYKQLASRVKKIAISARSILLNNEH